MGYFTSIVIRNTENGCKANSSVDRTGYYSHNRVMNTLYKVYNSKPNPLSADDVAKMKRLRIILEGGVGKLGVVRYDELKLELEGLEYRYNESKADVGVVVEGRR